MTVVAFLNVCSAVYVTYFRKRVALTTLDLGQQLQAELFVRARRTNIKIRFLPVRACFVSTLSFEKQQSAKLIVNELVKI